MKHRNGYVYREGNSWVARVDFTDDSGKRRVARRYCETKTEANRKRQELVRSIEERGEKAVDGDKLTFKTLAEKYKEARLIPAEYVNQRKIAGVRSLSSALFAVRVLVEHFGDRRVRAIKHSDIEAFKLARLKIPTVRGTERSITSVNRELEILRAILNFALRQDWISKNPFNSGASLISKADETHRERVMTFEEEERLLAACEVDSRRHLCPILIAAVDTGMRRGELLKLRWRNVDIIARSIEIEAFNTKTARARVVAMTSRLESELKRLYENAPKDPEGLVFGIKDNFKNGFSAACKAAEVEGLRFHDLRHTAITRMIEAGMQPAEVMRVSGHTTPAMLWRYLNTNVGTARRAADALDVLRNKK
ncbi:MAG: site-specific integrase [Acidobacteria bacterium]|nr:site-specific integrase [Acidobacteriota bacterium]